MFERWLSKKRPRSKRVDHAFYQEARQTTVVVTVIFLSLYIVMSLVGLLSRAASGDFPGQVVLTLLALETIKNVNLILPLTMFIGILLTLARWYRDHEITALEACGFSLYQFVRPAMVFAFWTAVVVSVITFYLAPLSAIVIDKVQNDSAGNYRYGLIPGQFNRSKDGRSIFYVGQVTPHHGVEDVFASSQQFGETGVLVAKTGREVTDPKTGAQYLELDHGTRYQGVAGQANFKILHYRTYGLHIVPPAPVAARVVTMDEKPTLELWASSDRDDVAEWQWRVAKPLSLFVLAPLAVALSYTDQRRGRFVNLFTGAFVYVAYANLIGIAHAMVQNRVVPLAVGLWWVHGLFLAVGAYLLWVRTGHRSLVPFR